MIVSTAIARVGYLNNSSSNTRSLSLCVTATGKNQANTYPQNWHWDPVTLSPPATTYPLEELGNQLRKALFLVEDYSVVVFFYRYCLCAELIKSVFKLSNNVLGRCS